MEKRKGTTEKRHFSIAGVALTVALLLAFNPTPPHSNNKRVIISGGGGVDAAHGLGVLTLYINVVDLLEQWKFNEKHFHQKSVDVQFPPYPMLVAEWVNGYPYSTGTSPSEPPMNGPPDDSVRSISPIAQFPGVVVPPDYNIKHVELPMNAGWVRFLDVLTGDHLVFPVNASDTSPVNNTGKGNKFFPGLEAPPAEDLVGELDFGETSSKRKFSESSFVKKNLDMMEPRVSSSSTKKVNPKIDPFHCTPQYPGCQSGVDLTITENGWMYFDSAGVYAVTWNQTSSTTFTVYDDPYCPGIPADYPWVDPCSDSTKSGICEQLTLQCRCFTDYVGLACEGLTTCKIIWDRTLDNNTAKYSFQVGNEYECCTYATQRSGVAATYDAYQHTCNVFTEFRYHDVEVLNNHGHPNSTGKALIIVPGSSGESSSSSSSYYSAATSSQAGGDTSSSGGTNNSQPNSSLPSSSAAGSESVAPSDDSDNGGSSTKGKGKGSRSNSKSKSTSPPIPPPVEQSWMEQHWLYIIIALIALVLLLILLSCIQRQTEKKRRVAEVRRQILRSGLIDPRDPASSIIDVANGGYSTNTPEDDVYGRDSNGSSTARSVVGQKKASSNNYGSTMDTFMGTSNTTGTFGTRQDSENILGSPTTPSVNVTGEATAFSGKYKVLKTLGRGAFGTVYLVSQSTASARIVSGQLGANSVLAMKVVRCGTDAEMMTAFNEFKAVKILQGHPNIVRLVDMFMGWESSRIKSSRAARRKTSSLGGGGSSKSAVGMESPALPGTSILSGGDGDIGGGPYERSGSSSILNPMSPEEAEKQRQQELRSNDDSTTASEDSSEFTDDDESDASSLSNGEENEGNIINGAADPSHIDISDYTGTAGSGGGDYYGRHGRRSQGRQKVLVPGSSRKRQHREQLKRPQGKSAGKRRNGGGNTSVSPRDHDASRFISLVMEYYSEGTLEDGIAKEHVYYSQTSVVLRVFSQLLSALHHSHKHNIVHRDLKPANVLIHSSRERVVVSDFGLAKDLQQSTMEVGGGTLHYLAPEQIDHRVSQKSDVWSIACIVVAMITGCVGRRVRAMFMLRARSQFEKMLRAELKRKRPLDQKVEFGCNDSFGGPPSLTRADDDEGSTVLPPAEHQHPQQNPGGMGERGDNGLPPTSGSTPSLGSPLLQPADGSPAGGNNNINNKKSVTVERMDTSSSLPEPVVKLLFQMLEPSPSARPSTEECCKRLAKAIEQ